MKIGGFSTVVLAILTAPLMAVSGDVLQHHVNGTRDGAYVDPLMTRRAAAGIRRDKTSWREREPPALSFGQKHLAVQCHDHNCRAAVSTPSGSPGLLSSIPTAVPFTWRL